MASSQPHTPSSSHLSNHTVADLSAYPDDRLATLQNTINAQAARIASLERTEQDNVRLSRELGEARDRIEAIERHHACLHARRREAVAQFLNMRPLHYESANTFEMRARDIQLDDLESMLTLYGNTVMTVINAQQRAIAFLSQRVQQQTPEPSLRFLQTSQYAVPSTSATQPVDRATPISYAYPAGYMQNGYCLSHRMAYPCSTCGR
ncbi:hypothetical protein J1614_000968 [Plenodomus biglobosus]|nr:hypothetical protein J1614_000968 [Plenodomus biglobosus]